jgi:glycosyltransferase involved in cell wall biosynthesis
MVTVSVIIPCYNQGEYINDAVESILCQTYQDFEIIIVNDGSNDESTIKLLENYKKPKTVVYFKENGHLSSARNFGIKKAQGKYILPLDADDYFEKTFLEKAVEILDNNPEVSIIKCWVKNFGTHNNYWFPKGLELQNFLVQNQCTASILYRKKVWERVSGYDETMNQGMEDWDFIIKALGKNFKIACIEEPLFFYRRKQASMIEESFSKRHKIYEKLILNNIDLYKNNILEVLLEKEKIILGLQGLYSIINAKNFYIESLYSYIEDETIRSQIKTKITKENFSNFIEECKNKKVYFYGAGEFAENLNRLYDFSLFNLLGFIDSNLLKKGQKLGNYSIFHTKDLLELKPDIVALTVLPNSETVDFLIKIRNKYDLKFVIVDIPVMK